MRMNSWNMFRKETSKHSILSENIHLWQLTENVHRFRLLCKDKGKNQSDVYIKSLEVCPTDDFIS